MGTRKIAVAVLAAVVAALVLARIPTSRAENAREMGHPQSPQDPQSAESPADQLPPGTSTSSKTVHRKTGTNSSETIRHTRVVEKGAAPPELTQAEDLIQKRDYAAAEPLPVSYTHLTLPTNREV